MRAWIMADEQDSGTESALQADKLLSASDPHRQETWIGCYPDPLLAIFDVGNERLGRFWPHVAQVWEVQASEPTVNLGAQIAAAEITPLRRVDHPMPTLAQRIRFAVLIAL